MPNPNFKRIQEIHELLGPLRHKKIITDLRINHLLYKIKQMGQDDLAGEMNELIELTKSLIPQINDLITELNTHRRKYLVIFEDEVSEEGETKLVTTEKELYFNTIVDIDSMQDIDFDHPDIAELIDELREYTHLTRYSDFKIKDIRVVR
jgi:hypothetical protein